jgi:hypothetical protein
MYLVKKIIDIFCIKYGYYGISTSIFKCPAVSWFFNTIVTKAQTHFVNICDWI